MTRGRRLCRSSTFARLISASSSRRGIGIYNKAAQFVASLQAGAGDASIKTYIDALKVVCDKALSALRRQLNRQGGLWR